MITQLGEKRVKEILSDFSCPKNKDVEYFLKYRALDFAKQRITQTQLIFLQYKGEARLAAYYSLTQKAISVKDEGLSKNMRKKVNKFGTRDKFDKGYVIPAPLIAQLGKNFNDDLNKLISGDELLKMALDKVREGQQIFGGKITYIECEDNPKLLDFYSRNGFITFGKREKDSEDEDRVVGDFLVQLLRVNN